MPCPKSVGVWYRGVPSVSNAATEKMNGDTARAWSGKPARAVAVVDTCHDGIPMIPTIELRWTPETPTVIRMPLEVSSATSTTDPDTPCV